MTNYERIKTLTLDEMWEFILKIQLEDIDFSKTFCSLCYQDCALDRKSPDCDDCVKWWLKNNSEQPQGIDWNGGIFHGIR